LPDRLPSSSARSTGELRTQRDKLSLPSSCLRARFIPFGLMNPFEELVQPMDRPILSATKTPITCAAISPDDGLIITGEESGSVKLWNAPDLTLAEEVAEHEGAVTGVSFVGSANRAYSAGLDGVVHFLDRRSNNHFELPRMHPITASDVASDGSVAVVGESRLRTISGDWRNSGNASINACDSGFVSAWDIASHWGTTRRRNPEVPLWRIDLSCRKLDLAADGPQSTTFVRISPDARLVAFTRKIAGMNPGELEIVDLRDGTSENPTYWGSPSYAPVAAVFSADSQRIYVITWEGLLLEERAASQQSRTSIFLERPIDPPKTPTYEEWLAELGSDTSWAPWWAPSAVSASPDGHYLLMGSRLGKIRVYDIPNRRRVAQLVGHAGEVTAVKFFADMKHALSAGMDGTLRIWKLPRLEAT
jgi:WD40 repeat protein